MASMDVAGHPTLEFILTEHLVVQEIFIIYKFKI